MANEYGCHFRETDTKDLLMRIEIRTVGKTSKYHFYLIEKNIISEKRVKAQLERIKYPKRNIKYKTINKKKEQKQP